MSLCLFFFLSDWERPLWSSIDMAVEYKVSECLCRRRGTPTWDTQTGERKCGSTCRHRPFEETHSVRMSLLKWWGGQGRRINKNYFVVRTSTLAASWGLHEKEEGSNTKKRTCPPSRHATPYTSCSLLNPNFFLPPAVSCMLKTIKVSLLKCLHSLTAAV